MYLSRLILNRRSRDVRHDLARPYDLHRTLLSVFLTGKVDVARDAPDAIGLLYRLDEDARTGGLHLLVQSQQAPQWERLQSTDYLLPVAGNPASREIHLHVQAGQQLTFRLRANPTMRLPTPKGSGVKGKRVGIYEEEAQLAWLARKGEQHGFRLLQAQTRDDGKIKQGQAVQAENGVHSLELLSVQFDGFLQVIDPDVLVRAISGGIGSGKAFGFGLLSLARVN